MEINNQKTVQLLESLEKLQMDLVQLINLYINSVKYFIAYKDMNKETQLQINENASIGDKIKMVETHYDKIYETNIRTKVIVETGEKIETLLNDFNEVKTQYSSFCSNINDETAIDLNNLLGLMKELELKRKPKTVDI